MFFREEFFLEPESVNFNGDSKFSFVLNSFFGENKLNTKLECFLECEVFSLDLLYRFVSLEYISYEFKYLLFLLLLLLFILFNKNLFIFLFIFASNDGDLLLFEYKSSSISSSTLKFNILLLDFSVFFF